jgi:hypothetical protein
MSERIKNFELQGTRWQVKKVNALDGSNILRKFTNSGAKNPQDFLANMPDDQFKSIQDILLAGVSEIQVINGQEVNLPLVLPSGTMGGIAGEDAGLVFMLTVISLVFNMSGFFEGNTLTEFHSIVGTFNV